MSPKRKTIGLSRVVALVVAAALLPACGSSDKSGSDKSGEKVALLDSGSRTDFAWSESWFDGTKEAKKAVGDKASIAYTDQLTSADALEQAGGAALSQGAKAVIYATSEVPQALDRLGQKFPKAFICGIEPPRKKYQHNVCTIYPHMQEGSFLAGVLAARTTKTNHIGTVGAFDSPTLTAQMEGFALGARSVNKDIKVDRTYTQSLSDSGAARAAAGAQYESGADIVYAVLSEARTGVFAAAKKHHAYAIGAYVDWYSEAPDVVLTSVLYHLDQISKQMLESAAAGKLEPRVYEFGLADGPFGVLSAPKGNPGKLVSSATLDEVKKLQAAIADGKLVLPGALEIGKRGAANKYDLSKLNLGS